MQGPGNGKYRQRDTASALARYPKLSPRISAVGEDVLEGEIDLTGPDGEVVESYQVKMLYTDNFPRAYPKVYETGGKFQRQRSSMHINGDGTLCLNSEPGEAIDTHRGMDTCSFIEKVLLPNLAWRTYSLEQPADKLAEFSHGIEGTIESYQEILQTDAPRTAIAILDAHISKSLPHRNERCLCGSGKKFKNCHQAQAGKLGAIPVATLETHAANMKKFVYEKG